MTERQDLELKLLAIGVPDELIEALYQLAYDKGYDNGYDNGYEYCSRSNERE